MLLLSFFKKPFKPNYLFQKQKLIIQKYFFKRHSSSSFQKFAEKNEKIAEKIINQDFKKIVDKEILVYKGQLTPNIKRIKIFSLTTTFIGLICYPFMFKKASNSSTSGLAFVFVGWTLIMVIFSPLALNFVTKRYITKLTFNKNSKIFTAHTLNFFNQQVETKFTQADVNVPAIPGLFTSFHVNKKSLFLDPAYIEDLPSYQHLLGYDKPLEASYKKKTKS